MASVDAIFFDLDATLVDYDSTALGRIVAGVCADLAVFQPGLDAASLQRCHEEISPQHWQAWGSSLGQAGSDTDRSGVALMRGMWQAALATCGCTDPDLAAQAFELYWTRSRGLFAPFEDVLPVLQSLQGRFKLAVVTNGPADTQLDKLQTADLERYFDLFVASGGVGVAKPDPRIFRHALEELRLQPGRTWHVGDWIPADVVGACQSGLTAVWLNRRGSRRAAEDPLPDHEIKNLLELLPLLKFVSG
jgi:HAD superfamily hydrolase (TIGR01509 family)